MASLAQLRQDVAGWLDRRNDIGALMDSWVRMVETDISEVLRARCMVVRSMQPVDAAFITLPADFCSMESLRWADTGKTLDLEDHYTGPADAYSSGGATTAYRLVGNCLEFLPPPRPPSPPDPAWAPRSVNMAWYQKPRPLIDPQDTNGVLESLYSVYLFGTCRYGAMFEIDDARATQMEAAFAGAVTQANLWKQMSDYSGAPLRAVVRGF